MLSDDDLENWCSEQMDEQPQTNFEVKRLVDLPEEPTERKSVRRTIREFEGYRETPSRSQRVCVSFRVWRRDPGELGSEPKQPATEPVVARSRTPYVVLARETAAWTADDLDDWLQLPPSNRQRLPWCHALDECLVETAESEKAEFETTNFGGWFLEVELHAIYVETDVVDTVSPRARAWSVAGFAKTKRLGWIERPKLGTKEPSDGCVAYGTLDVVHVKGEVPPSWFGVDSLTPMTHSFVARLGDGVLAEGFEAALCRCRPGGRYRVVVSGECVLPDIIHPTVDALVAVDVALDRVDATHARGDAMSMTMDQKEVRSVELKARGASLWAAGRWRRAETVWAQGVKLFSFIKPEDSGMDPHDFHLRENERGRALSIPLLLNEALAMRKRGALDDAKQNLDEAIDYNGNHVKALFRRGQLHVDRNDWHSARSDFRRCLDLGGPEPEIKTELKRLRKKERAQDAKDGKYFKHTFDDDIYADKSVDQRKLAKAADEIRYRKAHPAQRDDVVKKIQGNAADWTASYSTKDRPKITTATNGDTTTIESLEAELEEIEDEEEEAARQAKQDYYNTQIALGNMRIHAPPPT